MLLYGVVGSRIMETQARRRVRVGWTSQQVIGSVGQPDWFVSADLWRERPEWLRPPAWPERPVEGEAWVYPPRRWSSYADLHWWAFPCMIVYVDQQDRVEAVTVYALDYWEGCDRLERGAAP
jgi:hypothetical protein